MYYEHSLVLNTHGRRLLVHRYPGQEPYRVGDQRGPSCWGNRDGGRSRRMALAGAAEGGDEVIKDMLEVLAEEEKNAVMGCHNCGYLTTVLFCT